MPLNLVRSIPEKPVNWEEEAFNWELDKIQREREEADALANWMNRTAGMTRGDQTSSDEMRWSEDASDEVEWSEEDSEETEWSEEDTDEIEWSEDAADEIEWSEDASDEMEWSKEDADEMEWSKDNSNEAKWGEEAFGEMDWGANAYAGGKPNADSDKWNSIRDTSTALDRTTANNSAKVKSNGSIAARDGRESLQPKDRGGKSSRGERMLVTQALDERDLLVKKINDKIEAASFVDVMKRNEEKVFDAKLPVGDFEAKVGSTFQQIRDLIKRFEKIDAAIVASNAATTIETTYGTYTVAAAIALRNRIRSKGSYGERADFETRLYRKMKTEYQQKVVYVRDKNKQLQGTAENMRLSILGRDSKGKDNNTLDVVEAYIRENTTELVDPINIRKRMESIAEKQALLASELETKIKVSNATTFIEIE
ncbi:MAG: hypothetical protein LUH00_07435 [Lachnospiraceae bacterium]|nr:hypothetical protein [Lachnospiraceae bacterium]